MKNSFSRGKYFSFRTAAPNLHVYFVYFRDRLQHISTANRTNASNVFFFFTLQCKRMYFQLTKLTNIFYFGVTFIHSLAFDCNKTFVPLSVFTIESVARNVVIFSDSKVSRTIARKTDSLHVHVLFFLVCGLFVQLISREISQAPSSLTFSTRDSILETCYSKLSRIEYRVSRLEDQGSRDCQLTFERYCIR